MWYRRGMPRYPRMNWGKKVRLKPTKRITAANFPRSSEYMRPVILGHQKWIPPR
ncbi:hypothetical protein D3C87_2063110 [compost metagenome]